MSEFCKGCGVKLQNEDQNAIGYTPSLDAPYCQRCFKLRHYGDLTINMQQGIATEQTLKKINDLEGVIFWTVDLFNLESNLVSRINRRLPGKKIVLVLTKRDVLPQTLSDAKIYRYIEQRLAQEEIEVVDVIIAGYMLKDGGKCEEVLDEIHDAVKRYAHNQNVIFMGMANSGKSTLVNKLLGSADLTISRNPGTTLDVIERDWDGRKLYDTPGLEDAKSLLTYLPSLVLKEVIPTKPLKPYVSQIYEDQSFAVGGLARLDVMCKGKASVVGYFSLSVPIHRGKLDDADRLWKEHLGGLLSPNIDDTPQKMKAWNGPCIKPKEKIDVVIHGLGWFSLTGNIREVRVYVHQGIQVTFRKAMI